MRHRSHGTPLWSSCVAPAAAAIALAPLAGAGILATAIIVEDSPTPGSLGVPVSVINDPFTTTDGRVGFTGAIDDGGGNVQFVWVDGEIVWLNTDALPIVLTGAESTMGVGDAGQWAYGPSEDGFDAVWSDGMSVLKEEDPAPGFPGQFIVFCSRPQMNADGTPTWISGVSATQGGSTDFRVLYSGDTPVLAAGDIVDGQTIATGSSIGFAYDFSRGGSFWIARAIIDAPSASNDVFVVGNMVLGTTIVAREGQPTGQGDNWQGFGDCKINEGGHYVFSGDTDGAAATDGYLALDSVIIAREGDAIAGLGTLTGTPNAVAINDLGQIGAIWGSSGGEALILWQPDDAGGYTPQVLLRVGDGVDVDGDDLPDGFITDFNASTVIAPGLDLPRQCRVCANVDVDFAAGNLEANVCVDLPAGPGLYDLNGDGVVGGDDLGLLLAQFGGPGSADFNCDGVVDSADLGLLLSNWTR